MKTPKYARDQWASLRNKVLGAAPAKNGGDTEGNNGTLNDTPTRKKATPRKRNATGRSLDYLTVVGDTLM